MNWDQLCAPEYAHLYQEAWEKVYFQPLIEAQWADHKLDRRPMHERDTYGRSFTQALNLGNHDPRILALSRARRFVKLAADRQMALDDGVVGYLASHIERSFSAARRAVIRLDEEALRAHAYEHFPKRNIRQYTDEP